MLQSTNPSLLDVHTPRPHKALRPYQEVGVNAAAVALTQHQKIIFQLPTGGGKTPCIAAIIERFTSKSKKGVIAVVDGKRLHRQAHSTIYDWTGIIAQSIDASTQSVAPSQVYVAMIETLMRRVGKPYYKHLLSDIGLIIIDEAHVGNFKKLFPVFPDALFVGFTATPIAATKKDPLKNYFQSIVTCIDVPELIAQGALVQNYTVSNFDKPDSSEFVIKNGKFDDDQQGNVRKAAKHVKNTVRAYEEFGLGKSTIVYNASKAHNIAVCDEFNAAGHECRYVDDDTSDVERDRILDWHETTPGAIVCNVGLYTKGFDAPYIEFVLVNIDTMSLSKWLQMAGRGGRPHVFADGRKKELFILADLGSNAARHGDWNWERDWKEIFYNPPRVSKDGVAPIKSCPKCDAMVPASARVCTGITIGLFGPLRCGYEFPLSSTIEVQEFPITLKLITKNVDLSKMVNSQTFQGASGWTIMKQMVLDVVRLSCDGWGAEGCPLEADAELITNECYLKVKELRQLIGEVKLNAWAKNTIKRMVREGLKTRFPEFIYEPLPSSSIAIGA